MATLILDGEFGYRFQKGEPDGGPCAICEEPIYLEAREVVLRNIKTNTDIARLMEKVCGSCAEMVEGEYNGPQPA